MASGLNTQSNRTLRCEHRNHIKNINKQNSDRIIRLERRNNIKQDISTEIKNEMIQLNKKISRSITNNNNNNSIISNNNNIISNNNSIINSNNNSISSNMSSMSSIRKTRKFRINGHILQFNIINCHLT